MKHEMSNFGQMTKNANIVGISALFLVFFVGFRLLGPTINDPSDYAEMRLNVGEGEIFIETHATSKRDRRILIGQTYLVSPISFYLGVRQVQGDTISIKRVTLRQNQEESHVFETVQTATDRELKELEMRARGPSYRFDASPVFGADIDLDIELMRCRDDICADEMHQATIPFEQKSSEFGFWVIWAMMSV